MMRKNLIAIGVVMVILKVTYHPVPQTDIEYGQGAIERNELEHCVLADDTWLIRVPAPADSEEWRERLDASVRGRRGCFQVSEPTADELRRAESGELRFQK